MTVAELIEELKEMPQEKFIRLEVFHKPHRHIVHGFSAGIETIECSGANVNLTGWITDYD